MTDLLTRPTAPYRDDLLREVAFSPVRADAAEAGTSDGQTIDGYGAVFNAVTRIDSWEGMFDEMIAPGAMKKSVRERTPVMQYDHGRHPLIGSIPLGRWDTVEEDAHGLHVVGRLSDNWLIEPIRDAIRGPDGKGGGITGMSFRFSVVTDVWTDAQGKRVKDDELMDLLWYGAGDRGPLLRTLKEVKVSEVGPVAWPAYEQTSVGVRDRQPVVIDLGRLDLRTARARSALARAVALADLVAPRDPDPREGSHQQPAREAGQGVDTPDSTNEVEPQTTADTAGEHPTGPRSTEDAAGEHSTARDVRAELERRERMRTRLAAHKAQATITSRK